jgi:hypothetical protein
MNPIDKQVEAMIQMIRAAGGIADIDPTAPDYVKQAWLNMLLDCPDCREEMMKKRKGKEH